MINLPRAVNFTEIPACGISCLAAGLYHTACPSTTNETCLCIDQTYTDYVTDCVKSSCSIRESLLTERATMTGCGVTAVDTRSGYAVMGIVLFCFNSFFFFLRLANRATRMAQWGWDDTTIVIAWLLTITFLVADPIEFSLGMGKPYWAVEFWQIDQFLRVYYVCEVVYTLTLGMIKASILFLYIRIFREPLFKRVIWATQLFNLLLVLAFLAADFGQCRPISYFWQGWDGEHEGTCFDINALSYAHSGLNIVLDLWMLALPATQIWKLNMSLKLKFESSIIFAFGGLLTAISVARVTSLDEFEKDRSTSSGYFGTAEWTIAELTVGIVVACMPAARLVVANYASSLLKSARRSRLWRGLPQSARSDPSPGNSSLSKPRPRPRPRLHLNLTSRLGLSRLTTIDKDLEGGHYPLRSCGS